jgi:hypothetical protein
MLDVPVEIVEEYAVDEEISFLTPGEMDEMTSDVVGQVYNFVSDIMRKGSVTNKMRVTSLILPRMFANLSKQESTGLAEMREELTRLMQQSSNIDGIGSDTTMFSPMNTERVQSGESDPETISRTSLYPDQSGDV